MLYKTDFSGKELDFLLVHYQQSCADPENFVRGGTTLMFVFFLFVFFFLLMRGGRIQFNTISRLSSACQGNAIYMAFRWRADDGPW